MVVGRCGGSGGDEDGGGFCVGSGNVVRGLVLMLVTVVLTWRWR